MDSDQHPSSLLLHRYHHHNMPPPPPSLDARGQTILILEQNGLPPSRSENIPPVANSCIFSYDQMFPLLLPPGRFNNDEDETIVLSDATLDEDEHSPTFYHGEDDDTNSLDSSSSDELPPEDISFLVESSDVFRGLSEETVDEKMKTGTIGKYEKADDEVCVVCQEGFRENDEIGMLDNCTHVCHQECMKNWLMHKNFCPLCKAVGLNQFLF